MQATSYDRLVNATRELLWERGYTGTSPSDIQIRAGVGQGSMYHHFAGKSGLAVVALGESGEDLVTTADEIFAREGSAFDRIVGYLRRERPILRGCPIGRMTEDAEAMASDELRAPVERALHRLAAKLTELVAEGQQAGELSSTVPAHRIAATVMATVQGGYVLAKAANDEQPFFDAIEGVVDLLRAQLVAAR